jgi:hypothetical protein
MSLMVDSQIAEPLQLIVSLYRNTACRWPLHSFRDCIRGPESRSYDFDGMAWQNWRHTYFTS